MKYSLAAVALPALAMAGVVPQGEFSAQGSQIVGGTAAAAAEFPYIVSLQQSGSHFCGGVLINANTVLTAAHCSVNQSASSVRVRVGTNTWASGGTLVNVNRITVHPSFSSSTLNNDVALWRLSTSVPTSSTVAYAVLPASGSDPAAGTSVTVAGWGTTSEGSSSIPASLRKVSVPVVSRSSCQSSYGASSITTNMWCAGNTSGGQDSCQGDSGGPIVNASTKVLQGVVSWGEGCARAGLPGVYTRIGNYISWINSNI